VTLLYVADRYNNRVQAFNAITGEYVLVVQGAYAGPSGLELQRRMDGTSMLFVSENNGHKVTAVAVEDGIGNMSNTK
jgi:hypothetical protein